MLLRGSPVKALLIESLFRPQCYRTRLPAAFRVCTAHSLHAFHTASTLQQEKMLSRATERYDKINSTKRVSHTAQQVSLSNGVAWQDALKGKPQQALRDGKIMSRPSSQSLANALKPSSSYMLNKPGSHDRVDALGSQHRTAPYGLSSKGRSRDPLQEQPPTIIIDDSPPRSNRLVKLHDAVYFDENDFDDDANLEFDVEDPASKHTLPVPAPENVATAVGDSIQSNTSNNSAATSSTPLAWSSSPLEHKLKPSAKDDSVGQANHLEPHVARKSPPPVEDINPRPRKRRNLPWASADDVEEVDMISPQGNNKRASVDHTPLSNEGNKSAYLWDKTASAIKEDQKRLRQANKKLVKKNDATEESLEIAKSSKKKNQYQPVFLSEEQRRVASLVTEQSKSVFFTGSAGTGKSVLLREIISQLRKKFKHEPDRIAVTASTGLAACNIGGVTLHSFSGIGLGKQTVRELVAKVRKNPKAKNRWLRTKVLVIDEISMVDGDLFDKLEEIAREIRKDFRPFGGIKLVLTGDFFQLPPVPDDKARNPKFAFDAGTWPTAVERTIGLSQVFRQKDPVFANMLNEMRVGRLSKSSVETFKSLSRPIAYNDNLDATELFPTRQEVENANKARMQNLDGSDQEFKASDGGTLKDEMARRKLLANCMAPETIMLKKGAQVMLIKNMDESLVNGSLGKVIGFMDERTFDTFDKDEEGFQQAKEAGCEMDAARPEKSKTSVGFAINTARKWPLVRFQIADGTSRDLLCQPECWKVELPNGEIQASRTQIPLILAWALSIHKAQGQTLERVKVNLGRVFEKGQAYVALSRATHQEGLQVMNFDPRKVMAHDRVRVFYNSLYGVDGAIGGPSAGQSVANKEKDDDLFGDEEEYRRERRYGYG